jgi:uncharacterized membrane protein
MVLVFLLLVIESRRYRFFDVYRNRVRRLERSYYAYLFEGKTAPNPSGWMNSLSQELYRPAFVLSMQQALARRLRRNYIWIFLILLVAWFFKTTQAGLRSQTGESLSALSWRELSDNAALGHLPGWGVVFGVVLFYGWMLYLMFRHRETPGELAYGNVHV